MADLGLSSISKHIILRNSSWGEDDESQISNKISILTGSGYLHLCWNEKSLVAAFFFSCVLNGLKKQLNFLRLLTYAKTFIFQGPCTIAEELENRNLNKIYKVKGRPELWACWKCGKRITEQKNSVSSAKGFDVLSSLLMDFLHNLLLMWLHHHQWISGLEMRDAICPKIRKIN